MEVKKINTHRTENPTRCLTEFPSRMNTVRKSSLNGKACFNSVLIHQTLFLLKIPQFNSDIKRVCCHCGNSNTSLVFCPQGCSLAPCVYSVMFNGMLWEGSKAWLKLEQSRRTQSFAGGEWAWEHSFSLFLITVKQFVFALPVKCPQQIKI